MKENSAADEFLKEDKWLCYLFHYWCVQFFVPKNAKMSKMKKIL